MKNFNYFSQKSENLTDHVVKIQTSPMQIFIGTRHINLQVLISSELLLPHFS